MAGKQNEIVVAERERGILAPIVTPEQSLGLVQTVRDLIAKSLVVNVDYGKIPGVQRDVLLKPGAEQLMRAFGLNVRFEIIEKVEDFDRVIAYRDKYGKDCTSIGLFAYTIRAVAWRGDEIVGEGMGSCSTSESKYISRPRDCQNTALKMAQKRAMVGCCLSTLALSGMFTQDVDEDAPQDKPTHEPQEAGTYTSPEPAPTGGITGGGGTAYPPSEAQLKFLGQMRRQADAKGIVYDKRAPSDKRDCSAMIETLKAKIDAAATPPQQDAADPFGD